MQGGAPGTHPLGWVQVRGVLGPYVAAPRERAGYPSGGWVPQMGLFQQPARQGGQLGELEADGSDLAGGGSFSRGFGTRLRAGPTLPARESWRAE